MWEFKGEIGNDTGGRPVNRSSQRWFAQSSNVSHSTTKWEALVTTREGKKQESNNLNQNLGPVKTCSV